MIAKAEGETLAQAAALACELWPDNKTIRFASAKPAPK